MCGRFVQNSPLHTIQQIFDVETPLLEVVPNYNVAPTQKILSIVKHENKNRLETLHWGLVPFWAKDISIGSRMINARAETVAEKPSFRNAFKKRRCLIPADGFYEWKGKKGAKQPHYISSLSVEPFAFAGLWEKWTDKESDDDTVYKSCTIITTAARGSIREIHDRIPVILSPEFHEKWLNTDMQDPKALKIILREGMVHDLKYHPVSKRVNAVKNNDPSCIEPIAV
ncbi:MAG TPA: SOS response-associated peptidase [Desulfobacterales bacterium]|nr:SOS response-associated peptidase [Desulfobacterales bacterium]